MNDSPSAPWFAAALAQTPELLEVDVDGARLEVLSWGERGQPGILLAHGFAASARWWSFIGPLLAAEGRRVAALSFSGMGRSDWRPAYSQALQIREVTAAAEVAGLFDGPSPPRIVAHSFGGFSAIGAASQTGRWSGLVLIDTMIDDAHYLSPRPRPPKQRRLSSREALLARFRLLPPQDCADPVIFGYIAESAISPAEDGWTWATDPDLDVPFEHGVEGLLRSLTCPVAVLCGERSALMTKRVRGIICRSVPRGTPIVAIPDAAHHVLLDQPLALVAAIRTLLATWDAA